MSRAYSHVAHVSRFADSWVAAFRVKTFIQRVLAADSWIAGQSKVGRLWSKDPEGLLEMHASQ